MSGSAPSFASRITLHPCTMSASSILSQLKGLLVKTRQIEPKLSKLYPSDDQWEVLADLSAELSRAAKDIEDKVRLLRETRSERAWKESEEHRSNAESLRGHLFAKGQIKNPQIFRRNMTIIFQGPKKSSFDTDELKVKKESTRKRCELIRDLSADGVISWALAFPPSTWSGGTMAWDVFTCLLDDVEPELVQRWPPTIRETLQLLRQDEEALQGCAKYDSFLKGCYTDGLK